MIILLILAIPIAAFMTGFLRGAWRACGLPEIRFIKGNLILIRRVDGEWHARRIWGVR